MAEKKQMNSDEMKKRTQAFALRVIRLSESLPQTATARVIGHQLLRCGSPVGPTAARLPGQIKS